MSALDKLIENEHAALSGATLPHTCGSTSRRERVAAARAELAELRRRVEDAELMLRAAFPDDDEAPFISYGEGCDGETAWYVHRNPDDLDPIILDGDGTGLPILTAEARKELHGPRR